MQTFKHPNPGGGSKDLDRAGLWREFERGSRQSGACLDGGCDGGFHFAGGYNGFLLAGSCLVVIVFNRLAV